MFLIKKVARRTLGIEWIWGSVQDLPVTSRTTLFPFLFVFPVLTVLSPDSHSLEGGFSSKRASYSRSRKSLWETSLFPQLTAWRTQLLPFRESRVFPLVGGTWPSAQASSSHTVPVGNSWTAAGSSLCCPRAFPRAPSRTAGEQRRSMRPEWAPVQQGDKASWGLLTPKPTSFLQFSRIMKRPPFLGVCSVPGTVLGAWVFLRTRQWQDPHSLMCPLLWGGGAEVTWS